MRRGKYKKYKKFYRKYRKNSKLATKAYVKRIIARQIEDKYLDTNETPTNLIEGVGFIERITSISQGTTDVTRIGDSVMLKNITIWFQVTGPDTSNMVRVIVFQWHSNTNFVAPTIGDVLQYFAIGDNREIMSPYVFDYKDQFRVLYDKFIGLDAVSNYQYATRIIIPAKKLTRRMQFVGAGLNASNHVYILAVSDSTGVAHPGFTFLSRVVYEDA